MDDSSDILGGQLHIARHDSHGILSSFSFFEQFLMLGAVVMVVVSAQHLYPIYKQYQDRRYRKHMRRRHGIPDNDHRPFNVAYAAANKARLEREAGEKSRSRLGSAAPQPANTAQQRPAPSQGAAAMRQRHGFADHRQESSYSVDPIPGGLQPSPVPQYRVSVKVEPEQPHRNSPSHEVPLERQKPSSTSSLYQPAFTRVAPLTRHDSEVLGQAVYGKHGLDVEMDGGSEIGSKRARGEDEEMADDGATDSREYDEDMEVDSPLPTKGHRGSKRVASLGDESFDAGRPKRDKRARKSAHKDEQENVDDSMEHDTEHNPRGKKRDRASSFGEDSAMDGDDEKAHRHRRRRVTSHKKSGSEASRGKKRGREPDSVESEDEDSDSSSRRAARHKRGKKTSPRDSESGDEWRLSTDPLCKGRRIGEEWEASGVHYKVGPNGQRLRQALVKKSRSRFPMPEDSEHPDRQAHIDVFVEAWLTEEEYQEAKDRQDLAWQQSPTRRSSPTETLTDVPDTPTKGKNLLWASAAPNAYRRGSSQSSTSSASLRVNPFQSSGSLRRISTLGTSPTPETPKLLRHARSYSKWEKQDLEAAAMAKLREKVKQEATPSPEKPVTVASALVPPPAASAPSTNNTVGATNKSAAGLAPEAVAPKPSLFNIPSTTTTTAKATTSSLPTLSIPSMANAKTASSIPFPAKPAEAPKPPAATSTFTFGQPSATPAVPTTASSSAPAAGSAVPNFFAKPAAPATAAAPSAAPPLNIFGGATATGNKVPAAQPAKSAFMFSAPPAAPSAQPETKTDGAGPSLLSRLGGFAAAAPTAPSTSNASAAPGAGAGASATPASVPFVFAPKPSTSAPAAAPSTTTAPSVPKFAFGAVSQPTAPAAEAAPASTANATSEPAKPASLFAKPSTEAPKFNFGVTSNPAVPGSSIGGSAADSAMLTTPPKETPKDASTPKSSFVFGSSAFSTPPAAESKPSTTPAGPPTFVFAPASTAGASTTPLGAPKFSFGATTTPAGEPKTSSMFGNTTTPAGEPKTSLFGNTTTPAGAPKPSPFFGISNATAPAGETKPTSVFGQTTAPASLPKTGSAFGSTTPAGAPSVFGSSNMPSGQPKTTSVFGSTTTPAGEVKTSVSGATTTPAGEPPKPSYSFASSSTNTAFGSAAPAAGQTGDATKTAFGFGQSNPSTTPAAAPPKSNGQTMPTFSFSAPTGPNPFAAASTTAPAATPAAPTTSAFGTSGFGAAATQQKSMFAFATPPNTTGAFAFGKPNTDSTQQQK